MVGEQDNFSRLPVSRLLQTRVQQQLADASAPEFLDYTHFGQFDRAVVFAHEGGRADDFAVVFGDEDSAPGVEDRFLRVAQYLDVSRFQQVVLLQPLPVYPLEIIGVLVVVGYDAQLGHVGYWFVKIRFERLFPGVVPDPFHNQVNIR